MENRLLKKALEYLVRQYPPIDGRTRLLKLVYLADREWFEKCGTPYTEAHYYRWNHGPFAREVLAALDWLKGLEVVERAEPHPTGVTYLYSPGPFSRLDSVELDGEFVAILDEQARRWARQPLHTLLSHVYEAEDFKATEFGEALLVTKAA